MGYPERFRVEGLKALGLGITLKVHSKGSLVGLSAWVPVQGFFLLRAVGVGFEFQGSFKNALKS